MQGKNIIVSMVLFATIVCAEEPSAKKDVNDFFSFLSMGGQLSLSRESEGPDAGGPAELGFLDNFDGATEYHANFFLKYVPHYSYVFQDGNLVLSPQLSVEGHLSSGDTATADAWRFRTGLELDMPLGAGSGYQVNPVTGHIVGQGPSFNALYASLTAKYEANRDFSVGKVMVETELTPTIPSLWIGSRAQSYRKDRNPSQNEEVGKQNSQAPWDFRWRPFLDIDAGHTYEGAMITAEKESTIFRIRPRLHAELWLNIVARWLAMDNVTAFADYQYAYLPLEQDKQSHHFFQAGTTLGFTDNVGFSLTYTLGEQSPDFAFAHTFAGSLTLKF